MRPSLEVSTTISVVPMIFGWHFVNYFFPGEWILLDWVNFLDMSSSGCQAKINGRSSAQPNDRRSERVTG